MTTHYGEFDSEKQAKENEQARQIVSEINKFGISERQRLFIIYLLGLELEDMTSMRDITTIARELGKDLNMFLSDRSDEEKNSSGKINT